MKTFEEKRTMLCDMAEFYLDSKDTGHINVNDGVLKPTDIDSINFLLLMALTFSNDGSNLFIQDIEIDDKIRKDFVDMEFKKIMSLKCDIIEKGKIILNDSKAYYNSKYNDISIDDLNKIAQKLSDDGFHI